MSGEKSIQTFNMLKRSNNVNPTNHPKKHYTANVKILVDMFNSFLLSSNPQKVW